MSGGLVTTTFPYGTGLDDELLVRDALDDLAADAGLRPAAMDELWATMQPSNVSMDLSAEYPYSYSMLAGFGQLLSDEVVSNHTDELRELASLLALAAGASPDPKDTYLTVNGGLVAAQVILERVAAFDSSCDSQTMRAWAVNLGESPDASVLERVWQQAVEACPQDPTPRWWWGHRLIEDSISDSSFIFGDRQRAEAMQQPVEFFEAWLADSGAPAARAGLAETLLSQAEALQLAGAMPFTVRDYSMRARAMFEELETSHPSSSVSLGVARAAFVHGDPDAADLMSAIARQDELTPATRSTATFILERLRDFDAAAAVASPETPDAGSLALVATNRAALLPPTWEHADDAHAGTLFDATYIEAGGGDVGWLGVVPQFRRDYFLTTASSDAPECRAHATALNLVLAARYDDARSVDLSLDSDRDPICDSLTSAVEAADRIQSGYSERVSWDDAQNLARYSGDLDLAADTVERWLAEAGNPLAHQRRGEVAYLAGDWATAISEFEAAASTVEGVPIDDYGNTWMAANVRESWVMLGLAHEAAGDVAAALPAFSSALQIGPPAAEVGGTDESNVAAAHLRTAALLTERGDMASSLPHRQAAAEIAEAHDIYLEWSDRDVLNRTNALSSGAEYNNYAVGLLDQGRLPEVARKYAQWAVDLDPMSPVFTDTLAQAQEQTGDTVAAEKTYEKATTRDATTFQSLNNQGVLAAGRGREADAEDSLRAAVAAKPDYALAWFNLGILLGADSSFTAYADSQASFARAVRLDPSLRGASPVLRSDTSAFQTDLDISKAVERGWSVGGAARSTTQSIGWILVILALARLLLTLGLDKVIEFAATRALAPRAPGPGHLARAWLVVDRPIGIVVAVLATGLIGAWPLLGAGASGWTTIVTVLLVATSVTCLFVAAAGGMRRGWLPSMLLGASTAAVGYSIVPAPVDARSDASVRQRWGGVVAVGLLAAVALTIAYVSGMPAVRSVGLVSLGLLTTSLLPLRPFDGAYPIPRALSIVIAVALLVVTGGVALAWW